MPTPITLHGGASTSMLENSSFGEYITKEYGLLKQILSYLKPCDLWNAKQVCREWNQAVESLTDKNPAIIIFDLKNDATLHSTKQKPVLPNLVLYQPPYHSFEENVLCTSKMCNKCKVPYISGICPCSVIGPDTVYILLKNTWCSSQHELVHSSSCYRFCEMFMGFLLPASEHIQVSIFKTITKDPLYKQTITDEIVNQCVGGSQPVKCILILKKLGGRLKWIDKLLNQVVYRQGMTFALGGGELADFEWRGKCSLNTCDLILIALRGDHVIAHSDILHSFSTQRIQRFMEEFATKVGPLPEGWRRIALLAQCVDRVQSLLESAELGAFKEAFPSVPLFGMQVCGEFGIKNSAKANTERPIKRRKTNLTFNHCRTSSFLILTFKKC